VLHVSNEMWVIAIWNNIVCGQEIAHDIYIKDGNNILYSSFVEFVAVEQLGRNEIRSRVDT